VGWCLPGTGRAAGAQLLGSPPECPRLSQPSEPPEMNNSARSRRPETQNNSSTYRNAAFVCTANIHQSGADGDPHAYAPRAMTRLAWFPKPGPVALATVPCPCPVKSVLQPPDTSAPKPPAGVYTRFPAWPKSAHSGVNPEHRASASVHQDSPTRPFCSPTAPPSVGRRCCGYPPSPTGPMPVSGWTIFPAPTGRGNPRPVAMFVPWGRIRAAALSVPTRRTL